MGDRRVKVHFDIEDWPGTWEELGDAIDAFAEQYGIELSCIGMSGGLR